MGMTFVVRPEEGSDPFRIFSGKRGCLRHQKVDGLRVFLSLRMYWVMFAGEKNLRNKGGLNIGAKSFLYFGIILWN